MKRILFILSLIAISNITVFAQKGQKILYNEISKPKHIFDSARVIYLEPFVSADPNNTDPEVAIYLRNMLSKELRKNNRNASYRMLSDYNHTDWYKETQNKSQADIFITGTYQIKTSEVREISEAVKKYPVDYNWRDPYYKRELVHEDFNAPHGYAYSVPYILRKHTDKNDIELTLTMIIRDKNNKEIYNKGFVYTNSFTPEGECVGIPCSIPESRTISGMKHQIIVQFLNTVTPDFLPRLIPRELTLRYVKIDDKELKKEIRKNDFKSQADLLQAARTYELIYEAQKDPMVAENIVELYYVTGYLKDAQKWLALTGNKPEWVNSATEFKLKMFNQLGRSPLSKTAVFN